MNRLFILAQAENGTATGNEVVKKTTEKLGGGVDLLAKAQDWLATNGVEFAIKLATAIAVFIIGRWVVKLLVKVLGRILTRSGTEQTLAKFLLNIAYSLMMAFVVIAAMAQVGIDTTSLSAIIAAAGLAIGFALQGSLGNFASGAMLITFKPFKAGDLIEVAGQLGIVEEIAVFCTTMNSLDNKKVIIPNGTITSDNIINYSANGILRLDLMFGCGYNDDIREVKAFLEDLIRSDSRVLQEPAPVVAVHELGADSVNFVFRPYVRVEDYWDVHWEMHEAVKIGFDDRGFSIPYPQRDMHIHTPDANANAFAA